MNVKHLEGGLISEDGETITLRFVAADDRRIDLEIETNSLENAFDSILALLNKALEHRRRPDGPQVMTYLRAVGFSASSPVDHGQIILTFRMREGLERSYSIAPEFADHVCSEIQKAAEENRRLKPLTLQ